MTEENFRNRPINIDDTGRRKWIYAKQPRGKWYVRRTIFAWIVILFLVLAPIIKINGNPIMLFDLVERRFSIFGVLFWAQDTNILALIMSVVVVFIVLFTVVFGRFWCGWACPQTIFLEMVYRRIEYLFEGNYRKGGRGKTVTSGLLVRRILKHIVFIIISILITNVLLMWFTGLDGLIDLITSPIREHWVGFLFMLGISLFYYWIYSFFREQVCTMICPYGRMQGVLLDSKSISVIYDYKRGEPRGVKNNGDCIDCYQCISVCPTGIDIRNGTQLECINCTACIDECNTVMKRKKRPGNLIRYDSVNGVETGKRTLLTGRTYAYSTVLLILLTVLVVTIIRRTDIETTIFRVPGTIYQEVDSLTLSNIYNLKVINKTKENKVLGFRLIDTPEGEIQLAGTNNEIPGNGQFETVLFIRLKKTVLTKRSQEVKIGIYENNKLLETRKINFLGPNK